MDQPLHKIGEKFTSRPDAFRLIVNDHITFVDPARYNLKNVTIIDPNRYFITSGDAVEKTKVLLKHYQQLVIELESANDGTLTEYLNATKIASQQCEVLLQHLKDAKGDNCFLEIEWDCHVLRCVPKNPRVKT